MDKILVEIFVSNYYSLLNTIVKFIENLRGSILKGRVTIPTDVDIIKETKKLRI